MNKDYTLLIAIAFRALVVAVFALILCSWIVEAFHENMQAVVDILLFFSGVWFAESINYLWKHYQE